MARGALIVIFYFKIEMNIMKGALSKMTEALNINGFSNLNYNEMYEINGGGWLEALAVGAIAVGAIALTIAFPPGGVLLTAAICTATGVGGIAGVVIAARN